MPPSIFDSIDTNPSTADIGASHNTLKWAWTVFAIALFMNLAIIVFSNFKVRKNALFSQIAIMMLTTSAIAWFALASNLGYTPIATELRGDTRAIYYVRYIQYFINMPLQVLLLVLGTGFPLASLGSSLFLTVAAVVCGLVGALVTSEYKWGFFTIGVCSMLLVLFHLYAHIGRSNFPAPSGISRTKYFMTLCFMTVLWILYVIAWNCNEGENITDVAEEIIWYGILDTFNFPIWLAFFLVVHRQVSSKYVDVGSGKHMDAHPIHEEEHSEAKGN